MEKIRILVVDDSIIVRKMLGVVLAKEPDLEVVGAARNGVEALAMHQRLSPHIITLDVVMPGMDGLQTLTRLRKVDKDVTVIMFSSLTGKGAEATVEALARGANDYVMKPSHGGDSASSLNTIRRQLVPKIRALVPSPGKGRSAVMGEETMLVINESQARATPKGGQAPDIVGIGVSTGGPEALSMLLPQLSGRFPVPVVIVQHMPETFIKVLADRLDSQSQLSVVLAEDGQRLTAGTVYFAPGDHHFMVAKKKEEFYAVIRSGPPVNSCRPSVDLLFQSLARAAGNGVLAVVLTGMGRDGLDGARDLSAAGSRVWVQDSESSVVWGMPGAVARAGLARRVLPVGKMGPALTGAVGLGRR